MAHNGELLERALAFFLSSLTTLSEKTIEDTMFTIHNHDQVWIIYTHDRFFFVTNYSHNQVRPVSNTLIHNGRSQSCSVRFWFL